jgi:hypothetical protein
MITRGGIISERWTVGIRLISIVCCCCWERDKKWSDIGENDSGRLPFPSLEENDGVDNRESE